MNKLDQLLIRACKTQEPRQRLLSVHRRFFMQVSDKTTWHTINMRLAEICERYKLVTLTRVVQELYPNNYPWEEASTSYNSRLTGFLISTIRLASKNKFPGLTLPLRFRKREKANG